MNSKKVTRVSIGIFGIFATIYLGTLVGSIIDPVEVEATGGSEVIETVIPMIDDVIKQVQNNQTEDALYNLEDIKSQLKDTFFAEEEN